MCLVSFLPIRKIRHLLLKLNEEKEERTMGKKDRKAGLGRAMTHISILPFG